MTPDQLFLGRADLQVTSFKHTSPEKKAKALRERRGLVPIFPNSTAVASKLRLRMHSDATLRRDSWVNLAQTFVVEATMIKSYDHNLPSLSYKLAQSSVAEVRLVLGMPAPGRSRTTRFERGQGHIDDYASGTVGQPSPHTQPRVVAAGLDQLSAHTPLARGTPRRVSYGAAVHNFSDVTPRNEELDAEAHQRYWMSQRSARPGSGRSKKSLLIRIFQPLPSWKQVRSCLPSSQTVTAMVVTALLVAAAGGAVYGGYLLIKIVYTAMAGCYRDIAAVGGKAIRLIVGMWKWCAKIFRVFGLGVVKGGRAICGVLDNIIALAKALLGRH